jgi:hypothetical protein
LPTFERIAPADANVGLVGSTPTRVACVQPRKETASAVVATLFVVLRVLKQFDMTVVPVRLAQFEVFVRASRSGRALRAPSIPTNIELLA